jgi:hypothetical protein
MATVEKMIPPYNDISFWLVVNAVLFIYIGIFQLTNGTGPVLFVIGGSYLSAGAVVLGIIYLLLWMWRRTNKKMADRWIMFLSGLAVLGDLVFAALATGGSFTGSSVFLNVVGLLLFRSAYQGYRSPA